MIGKWQKPGSSLLKREVTEKQGYSKGQDDPCSNGLALETSVRTHVHLNIDTDDCIQKYLERCVHTWVSAHIYFLAVS